MLLNELLNESSPNGYVEIIIVDGDKKKPIYKAVIYDGPKGQVQNTHTDTNLKNLFDKIIDKYDYSKLQLLDGNGNLVNTKGASAYKAAKARIEDDQRKI